MSQPTLTAGEVKAASLTRYAWLSIAAALITLAMKGGAAWLTASVALLSDALESSVNLIAAIVALIMIRIAHRPPNDEYAYGFSKAEYFSSGFEGALILLAALVIIGSAVQRYFEPHVLYQLDLGILLSAAATVVNFLVARLLIRTGRQRNSIALEADGRHLMADVITSVAIVIALLAVLATGWQWLDPLIAIGVALNVLWIGYGLLRHSALGLLDRSLDAGQRDAIAAVLASYEARGIRFHALRTREAAGRSFVSVHVLVPGAWSVQRGHDLLEAIEADLRRTIPGAVVFTHLEPVEDPKSLLDDDLDRA